MYANPVNNKIRYASFIRRFLALCVDAIIIAALIYCIYYFAIGIGAITIYSHAFFEKILNLNLNKELASIAASLVIIAKILYYVIPLFYFLYFWAKHGQTPGNRIFRIKVTLQGSNLSKPGGVGYQTALLRVFCFFCISPLVFGLGFLWVIWDKQKHAWHDILSGTDVVLK